MLDREIYQGICQPRSYRVRLQELDHQLLRHVHDAAFRQPHEPESERHQLPVERPNGDRGFVFHTPTPSTAANGEFDDQFTWITAGELYGKLIAAGVLP